MNLLVALASALLLQPVLDADADLRLVASGTGDHDVDWYMDGDHIASTRAGEAVSVAVVAGEHDVWVTTDHAGPWRALVRPETHADGSAVTYVDAWSAAHEVPDGVAPPAGPILLALTGVATMLLGRRRPKRP